MQFTLGAVSSIWSLASSRRDCNIPRRLIVIHTFKSGDIYVAFHSGHLNEQATAFDFRQLIFGPQKPNRKYNIRCRGI